jgi:SAM-dependent methyltransferase
MTDTLSQLMDDWERQQTGFLPRREERFAVITRTLGEVLGPRFTVLDLGCGTGSLARRVLDAHPEASVIAVDADPVLLQIGRSALGDCGGRLRWVDADLRDPGWVDAVGAIDGTLDGAVSTTALHWLDVGQLAALYGQLAGLVRPGGAFLNGDGMAFDRDQPTAARLAAQTFAADAHDAFEVRGVPSWDEWWQRALAAPELADSAARRKEREAAARARWGARPAADATLSLHTLSLLEAGFAEAATLWQFLDDRVLLAVR